MKLRLNGFENEVIFDNEIINVLQIEDAKCYTHIIDILNQKINGYENNEIFLLDENEEEMRIDKNIYMIFDLFNIEYNSKKLLNRIYDVISENIQNSQELKMEQLIIKLRNYLIEEINELPFEFVMKSEISIQELLKIFDLKIDNINYTNVIERIELLIDLFSTLEITKILVIPNLKMYLSEEELIELYKYSLYNNINLLIIERNIRNKLKYEKVLAIDENYNDEIL